MESYFTNAVKLSPVERQRLIKGEPLTKMLEADETKEVAVFGAVWISVPIRRYVEAVKDIETFERGGGFRVTKRISAQPRLEDFSELRLPQEDLDDLPSCRVGDCDVKLGEQAIKRFRIRDQLEGSRCSSRGQSLDAATRVRIRHQVS